MLLRWAKLAKPKGVCPDSTRIRLKSRTFAEFLELLSSTNNQGGQLARAASSIALNLSEGNAKPSEKEKRRYYQTAYASCQECKTILQLAKIKDEKVVDTADKLGAWLHNLLKAKIRVNKF